MSKKIVSLNALAFLLQLLFVLLATGCGGASNQSPQVSPSASKARIEITATSLLANTLDKNAPVHNRYFQPIGEFSETSPNFAGTLRIDETMIEGTSPNEDHRGSGYLYFPAINVNFYTHQGYLVPEQQNILYSSGDKSFWGIILSPGKVWTETEDEGWSRASFPFVLTDKLRSQTHNGLGTFLFKEDQVSSLRIQIVQETADYFSHDYWGSIPMQLDVLNPEDFEQQRQRFSEYLDSMIPVEAFSKLESRVSKDILDLFTGAAHDDSISSAGIIYQNTLYLRQCGSRYGEYPYCQFMRSGSFSVAKSVGAGLIALWLQTRFGEQVLDEYVLEHLDIQAEHDGWENVQLKHLVDMASGIGDLGNQPEDDIFADEYNEKTGPWTWAYSLADKLDNAASYSRYPWEPGERLRYRTGDSFVFSAAASAWLKKQLGPEASLWEEFSKDVLEPIGIPVFPSIHTFDESPNDSVPLLGTGLFPNPDDIAKITILLQQGGEYNGQQLLSRHLVQQFLAPNTEGAIPDVNSGTDSQNQIHYRRSMWLYPMGGVVPCDIHLPSMAGYGGISVSLAPNGISAFMFNDVHVHPYGEFLVVMNAIEPVCD